MNQAEQHTFQVLTKRPGRAAAMNRRLNWTPNIWLGTSIESVRWMQRLDQLLKTDAKIKFLSLEPLLGPLHEIQLDGVDWVIVGGESGPEGKTHGRGLGTRYPGQLQYQQRAPFSSSNGAVSSRRRTGRILDGETWDQMPVECSDFQIELGRRASGSPNAVAQSSAPV